MKYSEFHIFSYIACILLTLLLVCCYDAIDEDFDENTSWPALVLEAKHYIDNYEGDVSLLNLESAYHNDCAKVKNQRKTKHYSDFILDWNSHYIKNEKGGTVLYVPIVQKREQALTMSFSDGRAKGSTHQVYSTLIVRKNNNNNNLVTLIGTYLYGRNIKENDVKNIGVDFESSNYTGYFITSRLNGTMLIGQCIENGKAKFRFRQNPLSPNERTKKTDTDHNHKHQHLFLNLMTNSTILTKSTKSIEGSMYFCSICYKPWDQCTCIEIDEYPLCSTCHAEIIGGLCDCYCYFCFELKSECTCGFGNNEEGNNSGGNSSPGGGSGGDSGGGGTSGGNSSNTGNGNTSATLKSIAVGNVVSVFSTSEYNRPYDKNVCGYCLRGWKTVWQEAGIGEYANCNYAKDFGPFLISYGFQEIPITWDYTEIPTLMQYTPQIGDTRVWQPYSGQSPQAGHIDWWNGTNWVSDFVQFNEWWPGNSYRKYPCYKIYR